MNPERSVCHLTSVHKRGDLRIFMKECVSLAEAGWRVSMIAPSSEGDATVSGVTVRSVPLEQNRFKRMLLTPWRLLRAGLATGSTVFHFHDPELLPLGLLLKLLGRQVVYDAHEDVGGDILIKEYLPKWIRPRLSAVISRVEQLGASCFDGVVTATAGIGEKFPPHKTLVLQNFPLLGELNDRGAVPYSQRSQRIAYVGMIARERGILPMIRALAFVPEALQMKLLLAGTFVSRGLDSEAMKDEGWKKVDYRGQLDRKTLAKALGEARAGVVLFLPGPGYDGSLPNKLFEYMTVGLPLVASDFPNWRAIIDEVKCGILVNPADPQAIAKAYTWILENPVEAEAMGERGRAATLNTYNWRNESKKLVGFYERLAALRSGSTQALAR